MPHCLITCYKDSVAWSWNLFTWLHQDILSHMNFLASNALHQMYVTRFHCGSLWLLSWSFITKSTIFGWFVVHISPKRVTNTKTPQGWFGYSKT